MSLERRWPAWTALSLSLAVLAHEHGLVLVLGVALVTSSAPELRTRGWWWMWLTPLGCFRSMAGVFDDVWGETPIRVAMGYLNEPFAASSRSLANGSSANHQRGIAAKRLRLRFDVLRGVRLGPAHHRGARALCLGWALATALLLLGTGIVWEAELSFWRAATAPLTLGSLVLVGSRARLAPAALLCGLLFGLLTASRLVWAAWHV